LGSAAPALAGPPPAPAPLIRRTYLGPPGLDFPVSQSLGGLIQSEAGPDTAEIGLPFIVTLETELLHDPFPVLGGEHQRDGLDLPEEVEIRCQGGDGPIQEHQVLDEQT